MTTYCIVFVGKKMEALTFGLNVNEGCYSMKVVYTKLILIEMKQCEHECYIHQDGPVTFLH